MIPATKSARKTAKPPFAPSQTPSAQMQQAPIPRSIVSPAWGPPGPRARRLPVLRPTIQPPVFDAFHSFIHSSAAAALDSSGIVIVIVVIAIIIVIVILQVHHAHVFITRPHPTSCICV